MRVCSFSEEGCFKERFKGSIFQDNFNIEKVAQVFRISGNIFIV